MSKASEKAEQLCEELKTLAERIGVKVREEVLLREVGYHARSGICKVNGEDVLFLDRSVPVGDRIEVLVDELRRRDLRAVYVSPALRRLLEPNGQGDPANDSPTSEPTA